ncbi:MAG: endonuclease domain-containing protein [Bacteroidota bacterium]
MNLKVIGPRRTGIARGLRELSTPAEKILWEELRNRRLGGFKFRRQHPLLDYILDFYCKEKQLAIEIDGSIHRIDEIHERDVRRASRLIKHGIHILRFSNYQVINNKEIVLNEILRVLNDIKSSPSPE